MITNDDEDRRASKLGHGESGNGTMNIENELVPGTECALP
jgi:hypothetical protein